VKKLNTPPTLIKLAVLVMFSLAAYVTPFPIQADDDDDYVDGQVVVKLNPASGATIEEINADYDTIVLQTILISGNIYLLEIPEDEDVEDVVELMEDDLRLLYAEPNWFSESPEADPSETWAWGGYDPTPMNSQYAIEMIGLDAAHQVTLGAGVVVAVLDTGVQLDHPDLVNRLTAVRYDFVSDDGVPDDEFNGLDDDGDGYIDEAAGHGTHVSGIVHLVAPQAQIMPLRVLDSDGRGNVFLATEAIIFAFENGADVINLSLGTSEQSELLEDMINVAIEAGVVIAAAAGNLNSSSEQYPAAEEGVIAVTAIGPGGIKADFANYGEWVDIAAPGEGIHSTFPVDGYAQWQGTSMATPFVAGQVALIRSVAPTMSAGQILALIQSTAQPIDAQNPGYEGQLGAGHIEVGDSVGWAEPVFEWSYLPLMLR
jgi:subtilisin family serine protease